MIIKYADNSIESKWNDYVLNHAQATYCHLFQWKKIIEQTYNLSSYYLVAENNIGEIIGILPLFLIRSSIFDNRLVSMPFLDYGGVLANNYEAYQKLICHSKKIITETKAKNLELRFKQNDLQLNWNLIASNRFTFVIDLPDSSDLLWHGFSAKIRNLVRKANKSGLDTFYDRSKLSEFYNVFATNMKQLGSPVHDRRFFESIFNSFKHQAELLIVRKEEKLVGGLIIIFFKDMVIVPWASSLRSYFKYSPNLLLYWEILKRSCQEKYKKFDFGRSWKDSGTFHFKKHWGAKPIPLNWVALNPENGRYNSLQKRLFKFIWSKVPNRITNLMGPTLRKKIAL